VNFPSNFGFRIHSSQPLRFVREGSAQNGILDVQIRECAPIAPSDGPLLDWTLSGSNREINAKLYSVHHFYRFWISDTGWYDIDPSIGIVKMPKSGDEILREQRLWGLPTMLCALYRGDFSLHAAAVEIDGGALLIAAPGRHGKTTLALAFHRQGYRVLTEDSACCRLNSAPRLLPGPPMLRVRPDMFDGRAPIGTQVVAQYDDRIYLALDENRRGSDDPIPIRGLIFLRESANEIHLERVVYQRALPDLWALNFHLPTDASRAQVFRQLSELANTIPIWNLYRPLRLVALAKTVDTVAKALRSAN